MQTYDWLSQGENIIFEGAANKQYYVNGINLPYNKGGKLILTDKQLVFQAHGFNVGTRLDKIPLESITGVEKAIHPLMPTPNMIKVETRLSEKYEFIVSGKDKGKWLEIIPKVVSEFKSRQGNTINEQRASDNEFKCLQCGYIGQNAFRFCPICGTEFVEKREHLFNYCPLQGIANNKELMGDAEKVLSLIDDYDKVLSDNSNEVESFVHAYMVFKNLNVDNDTIREAQRNGAIKIPPVGSSNKEGSVEFLTKNINDGFTEHHLDRLRDNIYRFSKTPNLNDDSFGSASGISLKFKLHGLETKCGMFEAKMMDAAQYMWKLLCAIWEKKNITVDPLQITMEFTRNFPLDTLTEAQTVQALIGAGIPKEVAYSQLSFVDDVDYVMEMIEKEKNDTPSLLDEDMTE